MVVLFSKAKTNLNEPSFDMANRLSIGALVPSMQTVNALFASIDPMNNPQIEAASKLSDKNFRR